MVKGDKGLGFTVAGGQNTTGYFFVKDILYEPAISNKDICKGDRILQVRLASMLMQYCNMYIFMILFFFFLHLIFILFTD